VTGRCAPRGDCGLPARVGDPVSVVTGASTDVSLDFTIPGRPPFWWNRYYDSSRHMVWLPLGWGHTHEYDRTLRVDLDGMRYESPGREPVPFPYLAEDGDEAVTNGLVLTRVGLNVFRLSGAGPAMEFAFRNRSSVAPLARLGDANNAMVFHQDQNARIAKVVLPDGAVLRIEYDPNGAVGAVVREGDRSAGEQVLVSYRYDASGNLIEGVDAYRNRVRFAYDDHNRLIRKVDRRGFAFNYRYDSRGRCVWSSGEDGLHAVQLTYLAPEPVTKVTRGDGGEWQYFYDPAGSVMLIVDPYGGTRSFVKDDAGRVIEERDPVGNSIPWVLSPSGQLLAKIVPPGRVERPGKPNFLPVPHRAMFLAPELPSRVPPVVALDSPDCPADYEYGYLLTYSGAREIVPHAWEISQMPEAARRALRRDLPFTRPRERVHDALGKLLHESRPGVPPRRWVYDPNGNVVRYTDHDGATRQFEYTSWNLRSAAIDPLGHTTRMTYQHTEKVTSIVDGRGVTSEYEYDLKDRLVAARHGGRLRDAYTYDPADELIEKTTAPDLSLITLRWAPGGVVTARNLASGETQEFSYDGKGRFVELKGNAGTVALAYDEVGNCVRDELNGRGVKRTYSGLRLQSVEVLGRFIVQYERTPRHEVIVRDPLGGAHRIRPLEWGIVHRTLSNGRTEVVQYDRRGLCVLKVVTRASDRDVWVREFDYSGEGDLVAVRDSRTGASAYKYDAAHRLIEADERQGRSAFTYDASGNLLASGDTRFAYADSNQQLLSVAATAFDYDVRGNCVGRTANGARVEFDYDSLDQLTRVAAPGFHWEATYDPFGRRVRKLVNGAATEFIWDGDRLAAEIGSGLRLYIYPDDYSLVPQLVVDYDSPDADPALGRRLFVFADHRGAPIRLEDDSGSAQWEASYNPYGRAVETVAHTTCAVRLPGHYFDRETSLHYNRFRYYDPALGRYLQPDPVGVSGGGNRYAYHASPLTRVDINGLGCPDEELPPDKKKELDEKFGAPEDPAKIKDHEMKTPGDKESGVEPNGTRQVVKEGETVTLPPLQPGEIYIWVIDKCGNMIVAKEYSRNGVYNHDDQTGRTFPDQPMGHPTLTDGEPARIGGELHPQPDGSYKINNKSGRYSGHDDRGPDQLDNAAGKMSDALGGAQVTPDYKPIAGAPPARS
jgi:RHS repeat-associated protein